MKIRTINKYDILNNLINKYNIYENIIISCIFKNKKILSYGISSPDIHLHSIKNNKQFSIHAEVNAINNYLCKYNKKERQKIGNVNMLIVRYKYDINNIKLLTSKPCQFCIKSIMKFDLIKKIYYTNNDNIYEINSNELYNNINYYGYSSGDRRYYLRKKNE